ncbi:MAG TPA: transglycosylase SLT domain-containing protein, partial [Acidimicrobiales bacterium]|nr:transglycosylase SLT domain-containing protein [Acidimicrobiales bacterium]
SMYQNLPPNARAPHSAGMWQFIPQTARNYGLVVTDAVDQRLDVPLETDAAMRYLGSNRLRFQDWLLALAAYNQGEGVVQWAIGKGGTSDAWSLVEAGYLNDYIVQVTAGAILIGNPDLLD